MVEDAFTPPVSRTLGFPTRKTCGYTSSWSNNLVFPFRRCSASCARAARCILLRRAPHLANESTLHLRTNAAASSSSVARSEAEFIAVRMW